MTTRGRHVLRIIEIGFLALCGTAGAGIANARPPAPAHTARVPDLSYILFLDNDKLTMSGNTDDIDHVRALRHGKEPLLWFRDGGVEYVVRDPATVQQVAALWKPVSELGDQMGKLGDEQGKLGEQQGKLGEQQGRLGEQQATLAGREAALDSRDRDGASDAQRAELDRQRQELRRQQRAIDQQMRALDDQMRALDRDMRPLDDQMKVLDRKMAVVERKAEGELRTAIRRAIASGVAQPVS